MGWQKIDIGNGKKRGQCSLAVQRGRLLIVFPRCCFGGKQRVLSLNLIDTIHNRNLAVVKLKTIQADIDLGQFDVTLERYRPQTQRKDYQETVKKLDSEIDLMDLWNRYYVYRKPTLKESTIHYLRTSVEVYLIKSGITSPYQALELRDWLLSNTTKGQTKRVLTYLNAAFNWGLKHKLLKGANPYQGMASELKHGYEIESKPCAFTSEEKQQVIAAFANYNNRQLSYRHYTNFVRFLFMTGCRPSEAIGLRWQDVYSDFSKIIFDGGIYQLPDARLIRTKGSKTNRKREFPCNSELQNFLKAIKPLSVSGETLIFLSHTSKTIRYGNFSQKIWNKVVDPIKSDTTPYSCRDTFITEQIAKGVNPAIVAKWVDNSTAMIERHYFDIDSTDILPQ